MSEIVRPMERGQLTIPVAIRKQLGITSQTWLWVKLIGNNILIEPVEKATRSSLVKVLNKAAADRKIYWRRQDDLALKKIREKSMARLKEIV